MNKSAKKLLLDLFRLKLDYSKDDFELVMKVLNDKEAEPMITSIIELSNGIDELITPKEKPSHVVDFFEQYKETEPNKYLLLREIESIVLSSKTFKRKVDLVRFASRMVHSIKSKDTIPIIKNNYLDRIRLCSIRELESELSLLAPSQTKVDSDPFLRMASRIANSSSKKS